jgi:hypothetical protein
MRKIFTFLFLGLLIFSCSTNDDEQISIEEEYPLITKMNIGFLPSYSSTNNFYFEYDNNKRLIKKTGGFLQLSGGTGLGGFFTDKIYTALTYGNNTVTVENFSSSAEFNVPKDSKFFVLNNKNQITKKEFPNIYNHYLDKTQTFRYENNQLIEIFTTLPNLPYYPPDDYIETYLEKFYYDSNGNLTKSEYFEQRDGVNKGIKIVRTFGNYDKSINAFKRLYLLDDYFYRSISKNNYCKYSEVKYNEEGVVTSNTEQQWSFNYDSNGNIIIN